jgi:phage gpG-like protein
MRALGLSATKRIVDDTTKGKAPTGGGFARYSPAYALKRSRGGRTTKPNLSYSARMLRDLKPGGITDNKVTLSFITVDSRFKSIIHQYGFSGTVTRTSKRGKSHRVKMNIPARPFVELSQENQDALAKLLQSRMDKRGL